MSHPGCRHSEETDVDRREDGGRLLHGGEEAAREELRLHGGLLQSGATTSVSESEGLDKTLREVLMIYEL